MKTNGTAQDQDLIDATLGGDELAFESLYHRYADQIMRILLRLSKKTEDAKDLAQETFLKAYENLHTFRGDSAFPTWLTRIAINCFKMSVRRKKITTLQLSCLDSESEDGELIPFEQSCSDREVELMPERLTYREAISAAFHFLPPAQGTILRLRTLEGMEYGEIAEFLGCSLGNVKAQCSRARRKTRAFIIQSRVI